MCIDLVPPPTVSRTIVLRGSPEKGSEVITFAPDRTLLGGFACVNRQDPAARTPPLSCGSIDPPRSTMYAVAPRSRPRPRRRHGSRAAKARWRPRVVRSWRGSWHDNKVGPCGGPLSPIRPTTPKRDVIAPPRQHTERGRRSSGSENFANNRPDPRAGAQFRPPAGGSRQRQRIRACQRGVVSGGLSAH